MCFTIWSPLPCITTKHKNKQTKKSLAPQSAVSVTLAWDNPMLLTTSHIIPSVQAGNIVLWNFSPCGFRCLQNCGNFNISYLKSYISCGDLYNGNVRKLVFITFRQTTEAQCDG